MQTTGTAGGYDFALKMLKKGVMTNGKRRRETTVFRRNQLWNTKMPLRTGDDVSSKNNKWMQEQEDRMLYFVGTLQDKTEVTCSHIMVREGKETIEVYFERPIYGGFDSARCILPDCKWMFIEGYSSQEIRNFESYMQQWEPQMFWLAKHGERRMESIIEETQRPNEKTMFAIREVQKMKEGSFAGDSYHNAAQLIEDIVQTDASREMVGRGDFSENEDLTDNEKIDMAAREILRRYRPAFEELAK